MGSLHNLREIKSAGVHHTHLWFRPTNYRLWETCTNASLVSIVTARFTVEGLIRGVIEQIKCHVPKNTAQR